MTTSTTPNHGLTKYVFSTGARTVRGITKAMNDNWDIIDANMGGSGLEMFVASGDTTTNINSSTNMSGWGSADISDDPYSFDGTTLTFDEAGTFEVTADADYAASNTRVNANLGIYDGTNWLGVLGRSGYIRNAEGHNHASIHARAIVQASSADTVVVRCAQEAKAETVTADRSLFVARKVA